MGGIKWQKPQQGWITCNVDATISSERKVSSFGSLLRDEYGIFIAGYGGQFLGDFEPKIDKAMAFREALSWVKSKGFVKVVFELDSLLVVQGAKRKGRDLSYFGSIMEDYISVLKDLRSSSVHFVKRSANITAHRIAREAIYMSDRKEWNLIPSFLINVISQILNNISFALFQ